MSLNQIIDILEVIFASPYGYALIFLSSFVEMTPLGWATPGGLFVAIGGFFSYSKTVSLTVVLLTGWFGAWMAFLTAYALGRKTGNSLAKVLRQEKNAERARILLEKHDAPIMTTSMMAGLTRFWIAYIAGSQRYKFWKFFFYSGIASLAWTSLMVMAGYLAGTERGKLEQGIARLGAISWLLVIVAVGVVYWKTRQEFKETNIDKTQT